MLASVRSLQRSRSISTAPLHQGLRITNPRDWRKSYTFSAMILLLFAVKMVWRYDYHFLSLCQADWRRRPYVLWLSVRPSVLSFTLLLPYLALLVLRYFCHEAQYLFLRIFKTFFVPPQNRLAGGDIMFLPRTDWQAEILCSQPVNFFSCCSFIRLLPNLWTQYFWMNQFWCKLAKVVRGAKAWNSQLWGQKVKGQGHTRLKIDSEAWRGIVLDSLWSSRFLVLWRSFIIARFRNVGLETGQGLPLAFSAVVKTVLR